MIFCKNLVWTFLKKKKKRPVNGRREFKTLTKLFVFLLLVYRDLELEIMKS